MDIIANALIAWMAPDEQRRQDEHPAIERIERILYVDHFSVWAYTIDIMCERALPQLRAITELEAAIHVQQAELVLNDPWAMLLLLAESELEPRYAHIRDSAYAAIKPLIEGDIEAVLDPRRRGKLIANRACEVRRSKRALYNWLSRYWQRGMTPNALLPRFERCGGPSLQRIVQDEVADSKPYTKRGRRPKWSQVGAPNMTAERLERLKTEIERAQRLYPGTSRAYLFQRITEECYHVGIEIQDNTFTYILAPQSERPSQRQFTYWYNKLNSVEQQVRHTFGEHRFEQNHRAVLGDSTMMALGPLAQLQIDAFDSGVPLVDGITRRQILGTAKVHLATDTFTRLITGFAVRLRGPDWEGAMLAVYNTTQDKVAFCQHYGIRIHDDEWPSRHLCHTILADRGEFKGTNADHLPVALGIEIQNTPPYRPDRKGIVERHIGLIKQRHLVHLDGAFDGARQRGDPNPLPDACLTPYEFTAILIRAILYHNNWQQLRTYPLSPAMLADGVRPYPLDLWRWGVNNRSGTLRTVDEMTLWHNLLPSDDTIVNERGIWFRGYRYDCARAHRDGWYVRARKPKKAGGGSWHVRAAYLPNRPGAIYLRLKQPDNTYTYETCALHPSMADFAQYDWLDLEAAAVQRQADGYATQESREQARANLDAQIDATLNAARTATHTATTGMSKAARQRDRRLHRGQEQATADPTGAWPAPAAPSTSQLPQLDLDLANPASTAGRTQKQTNRRKTTKDTQYIPASTYNDILSTLAPALGEAEDSTPSASSKTKESEREGER